MNPLVITAAVLIGVLLLVVPKIGAGVLAIVVVVLLILAAQRKYIGGNTFPVFAPGQPY